MFPSSGSRPRVVALCKVIWSGQTGRQLICTTSTRLQKQQSPQAQAAAGVTDEEANSERSGDAWPRLAALQAFRQAHPDHLLFQKYRSQTLKHATFDGTQFHSTMPSVKLPSQKNIAAFMLDAPAEDSQDRPQPSCAGPDPTWFISGDQRVTYQQVRQRTVTVTEAMKSGLRIEPDQVVVLHAPNHVDYGPVCWATFRLGGIVALISPSSTAHELERQFGLIQQKYNIAAVISHSSVLSAAQKAIRQSQLHHVSVLTIDGTEAGSLDAVIARHPAAPVTLGQDAPADRSQDGGKVAFLAFSSGTTGLPKVVEVSHEAVITNVLQFYQAWREHDRIVPGQSVSLAVLPFCHIYGLIVVLHFNLYAQTALVIQEKFQPRQFFNLVQQHGVSHLWLVPPLAQLLARLQDKEPSLASVKHLIVGAAPISGTVFEQLRRVMPQCDAGQGYGLTETSVVVSVYPGGKSQPFPAGSAGALISNVSAKIVDPATGQSLGVGETGELWSKSPSNALGYIGDAALSEATWDQEGFCHTGDEAYFDHEGVLFLTDRIKELIKVKGLPVAPGELEVVLVQHPLVVDACVVGKPSALSGEVPQAFVVLTDPSHAAPRVVEELKRMVSQNTAAYKHLAEVHFVECASDLCSPVLRWFR